MPGNTFIIIGAGISGLMAAQALKAKGLQPIIFDKGRGVGGRMATRRILPSSSSSASSTTPPPLLPSSPPPPSSLSSPLPPSPASPFPPASSDTRVVFDHGAQFITALSEEFRAYVQGWVEAGVLKECFPGTSPVSLEPIGGVGHVANVPLFSGIRGMTDLPKHLAQGLDVRANTKVVRISRVPAAAAAASSSQPQPQWRVTTEQGEEHVASHLLLSLPVPQALELLGAGGVTLPAPELHRLQEVKYRRSLAVMAALDGPSGLGPTGSRRISGDEIIEWVADGSIKGISQSTCVTIHTTAGYAERHWDSRDEERVPPVLEAAARYLVSSPENWFCHRWGFSTVVKGFPEEFLVFEELQLAFAGDAFGRALGLPGVEGAALSGLHAAAGLSRL